MLPAWKTLGASPCDIKPPLTSKTTQADFAYAKQNDQGTKGRLCLSLLQEVSFFKRK